MDLQIVPAGKSGVKLIYPAECKFFQIGVQETRSGKDYASINLLYDDKDSPVVQTIFEEMSHSMQVPEVYSICRGGVWYTLVLMRIRNVSVEFVQFITMDENITDRLMTLKADVDVSKLDLSVHAGAEVGYPVMANFQSRFERDHSLFVSALEVESDKKLFECRVPEVYGCMPSI